MGYFPRRAYAATFYGLYFGAVSVAPPEPPIPPTPVPVEAGATFYGGYAPTYKTPVKKGQQFELLFAEAANCGVVDAAGWVGEVSAMAETLSELSVDVVAGDSEVMASARTEDDRHWAVRDLGFDNEDDFLAAVAMVLST